ncbi:uncharacterized protein LOC115877640 [Sitophilus oryzae]|uniref:Uncharacterized protein LOC115877640 n=1 Tax=Sitophilus oryzae TaxID=7048 RepID=A0A6J2XFL6_SITOR|nr:uncharacterized protein LOC115877640 [Sitophilus oryzae]
MDVSFTNVLEGARQYFQGLPSGNAAAAAAAAAAASPYFQQQQHQQTAQPRQAAAEQHQQRGNPATGTPQTHWQHHNVPPELNRPPAREHTPVQRPPSASRPPSGPAQYQEIPRQYHNLYPQEQHPPTSTAQLGFQFTRPQSRETSNHQYQPHIVTSSPYHPPESPQIARNPATREQLPIVSSQSQSYQQAYQAPTSQYTYHQRPHYPNQPKTTVSYATGQYQATPQGQYYKQKAYAPPTPSVSGQQSSYQGSNQQQTYRTTHNLPPIAALSNYQSSKNVTKEQTPKVALPRTRLPSSSAYSHVTHTVSAQQPLTKREDRPLVNSNLNYNHYRVPPVQNHQPVVSQVVTQPVNSYGNVSNNSYYNATQHQEYFNHPKPAEVQNVPRVQSREQHPANFQRVNVINEPIKQKRESPLDLSVKTVRTSADSTEEGEKSGGIIKHTPSKNTTVTHSYPTLDINTIQINLTHRSQAAAVSAPKVEFQPDFNHPRNSGWSPKRNTTEALRKSSYEQNNTNIRPDYSQIYQDKRFHNGHVPSTSVHMQVSPKGAIRAEFSSSTSQKSFSYDNPAKRPSELPPPVIPHKIPKVENWRQSIDFQIEQKLSHYKQQQLMGHQQHSQQHSPSISTSVISHGYPDQNYQQAAYNKQNFKPNHGFPQEPVTVNHQYSTYNQPKQLYLNPASRSNSSPLLPTTSRQSATGSVNKRVLNLLRNTIEVKEQKKLEQQKSHDVISQRSDIHYPNTDVKAPLQPKPAIDRNNVSPVPPASVQDIKELVGNANAVMNGSSSDAHIEYLETVLEIRVRTKGELKQLHTENNNAARDAIIQLIIEDQMKSPQRPTVQQISSCSSTTSGSTSPPKLLKERQAAMAPRKRLFSRNEEESAKNGVPGRDKSGLRSSSETSVFDFPDSDDENEMPVLERQSLEAMRRDRRNSLKPAGVSVSVSDNEIKMEPPFRPSTPEDDIFGSICDTFVEQLKKSPVKRVKRKTSEVQIKKEVDSETTMVKQEPESEPLTAIVKEEPMSLPSSSNCETPLVENIIKSDSDSDSEITKDETLAMIRNKRKVRRKVLSTSESSDEEGEKIPTKDVKLEEEANKPLDENSKVEEDESQVLKIEIKQEITDEIKQEVTTESEVPEERRKSTDSVIVRPAKKPLFGDGSDFYPGWEEEVCNYKKSLRMPPSLIQVTRPPASMRLSTSLPDLDPCPQSPTTSVTTEVEIKEPSSKKCIKKFKSEPIDSDSESTSSFNLFSKKTNYDSEGSSSIRSLPNTKMENLSILDRLLEKCGGKKKRRVKRKEDHSPKVVPKSDNGVELLATPTPSIALSEKSPEKSKGLKSPVINAKSAVLPFRKDTVNNFKDAFINSGSSVLGVHDKFTTIVMSSRTRKETRAMKQRATIKEVFGEDRPASAPPVTCINDAQIKEELKDLEPFSKTLEEILVVKKENVSPSNNRNCLRKIMKDKLTNSESTSLLKELVNRKIKTEVFDDEYNEDNVSIMDFIRRDIDARSETTSLDGDETMDGSISGKRRSRFGKMRRKLSSGFDYIRKKKKVKKEETTESSSVERRRRVVTKAPESVDDIQKEIKTWVMNKGIGETHLHRAARLGYEDITAYCLEKMECNPSPKDNAGYTPLHEACIRGHLEIARFLLQYGANVHESAQGGVRPLHEAVENGFVEIVRLLLSYGADPSLATYSGVTPLSLAADETTRKLLMSYMTDKEGESGGGPWEFQGPASCFDPEESGYDILDDAPEADADPELEDIDIDMSETLPPNLYTLRGEPPTERWVLLQDLSNQLKIKSRDALLRQIAPPTSPNAPVNYKSVLRELKMTDFLEQAHCCQFLNMGEKINTRATKIALVKYSDKVKELLGIETTVVTSR